MQDADVLAQLKEIQREVIERRREIQREVTERRREIQREVTERQGLRVDEVNKFFLRRGLFSSIPVVRKLADALAAEKIIVLQREPDSNYRTFDAEAIAQLEWALQLKLINWPTKKIVRFFTLVFHDIVGVVEKDAPVPLGRNRLARLEASCAEWKEMQQEAIASFERLSSLSLTSIERLRKLLEGVHAPILAYAKKSV